MHPSSPSLLKPCEINISSIFSNANSSDPLSIDADISDSAFESAPEDSLLQHYPATFVQRCIDTTLAHMDALRRQGLTLPYFAHLDDALWQDKAPELDIYLTNSDEGRQLNLESRGKDYATNILSYPSDLPESMLDILPTLPLGELIICHAVVAQQAQEQGKPLSDHISHLLVHGTLHLLGFDHELGAAEQAQMEGFEIDILAKLGIGNPYW